MKNGTGRSPVAFVGLGVMGLPMAVNLAAAGYPLRGFDTGDQARARAAQAGIDVAPGLAGALRGAEVVITMLPDTPQVLEVAEGAGGITETCADGTLFIDMSTISPLATRELAERLRTRGIHALDAPVSGGVRGARSGTVAVMASGPRADVAAVEPALKVIGKFFFIGERPGAGQTMKLCNNVLSAAAMAATSESMVAGVKAGLDPRIMIEVINASSGRSTATEQKFPDVVIPRTFNQGFTAGLMLKDVNLFLAEAKAIGVPVETIEAVAALLKLTCDELGPDKDITTVVQPIERRAGVEVRAPHTST
jgi:hypothetical protein